MVERYMYLGGAISFATYINFILSTDTSRSNQYLHTFCDLFNTLIFDAL
jgi:hypothetical protein